MGNFQKPRQKPSKSSLPFLNLQNPQIRKTPKYPIKPHFLHENFINQYEKYFPTIASNITIPNGSDALYISKNLNRNQEILSTKSLKTKESFATNSRISDSLAENSQNFFFRQSLLEQDREITHNFKNFKGINRIKPDLKEKFRNKEFLKVTKSLLIANNNQTHELKPENKKILGLGTQDLLHLSKYIDPNMIKDSIIHDNTMTYIDIQKHFGLQKDLLYENSEDYTYYNPEKESRYLQGGSSRVHHEHFSLEGTKLKTKRSEETKTRPKKRPKGKNTGLNSVKKLNFKKSQNNAAPITESLKKMRLIEQSQ